MASFAGAGRRADCSTALAFAARGGNRDSGDRLYNIMPPNARATLTHRLGGWDNGIERVMVSAKEKVSAVRNEVRTPAYELVNLRASHAWKALRLDLAIDNLFDRPYFHPLGGAYLGQGTTMTNAGAGSPAWGLAVPGAGRSFKVAVNVGF